MKRAFTFFDKLVDMPIFPSFHFLEILIGEKKVLDIGCGVGRYLERFSKESVGLEISSVNIQRARKRNLQIIKADVNRKFPVKNNQIEVVFASHIIEHVHSPFNLLQEAHRVLKKDGMLILGFPVENSLARIIGDSYFKDHPDHLYSFSVEGIKRLLNRTDFHFERIFIDINLVGRFPILRPILYVANRLPLCLTLWWANAIWIVAKKVNKN